MDRHPDVGWDHLAEARWGAARASFEEALSAEQTPEDYEGLSWAGWWLDDAGLVLDARQHAHRLYRERGDAAAAARMATWLACDQLDFHGAWAVAEGWLRRARRLLEPLEPGPDHGWLSFFEGYMAHAGGDSSTVAERAREAANLGRSFAVPDLEMLGLALEGAGLVADAQVEDGMRCLDEATVAALAGEATIPISGAWTCCFLVSACTAVLDFERAYVWCDRIADFAERYGSRYMLAFCRAEYGAVHTWRGRWTEAEAVLKSSIEDFAHSRPAMVGAPLVGLAELRRRQGRPAEAMRLLEDAGESRTAQLCRARIALERDDVLTATELLERLLRQLPPQRRLARAPALELLARAHIASGKLDDAAANLHEFREIAELAGTIALKACADLVEGMLLAAGGDHERARPMLEDAVDGYERSGAPFDAAQARVELAATLAALGRADQAEHESAVAHQRLAELAAGNTDLRDSHLRDLTLREREVLGHVAEGLTNLQIAERLVLSEHTIHRHVTNILRKLDAPSRTAAAAHLLRSGT